MRISSGIGDETVLRIGTGQDGLPTTKPGFVRVPAIGTLSVNVRNHRVCDTGLGPGMAEIRDLTELWVPDLAP